MQHIKDEFVIRIRRHQNLEVTFNDHIKVLTGITFAEQDVT
jgi:hypothetical protein